MHCLEVIKKLNDQAHTKQQKSNQQPQIPTNEYQRVLKQFIAMSAIHDPLMHNLAIIALKRS